MNAGFTIPPEILGQMNNLVANTMKQAKEVRPRKKWFLKKFATIEEIKDFLSESDNISDVQLDFEKLYLLFAKE